MLRRPSDLSFKLLTASVSLFACAVDDPPMGSSDDASGVGSSSEGDDTSSGAAPAATLAVRIALARGVVDTRATPGSPRVLGSHAPLGLTGPADGRSGAPYPSCSGPTTPIGQAAADALESLRYYVRSIRMCENLVTHGSGYDNAENCLSLYAAPTQLDYDSFGAEQARVHPELYTDLLDPTSVASLGQTVALDAEALGAFNYGIIDWYRPVIVRASVELDTGSGSATTLHTRDGVVIEGTNTVDDLTVGPASDGVAMLNNGGTWFRFQRPFEVTQADLDGGTQFALDLVFNPDRIISGMSCTTRTVSFGDSHGRGIFVPMLELSPVPHRAGQATTRESYAIHVDGTSLPSPFDLRLELYGVESDPNRTVYGVDLKGILAEGSTFEPMAQKVSFVVEDAAGGLEFQDYEGRPLIAGLVRQTEVGAGGTLVLPCNGGMPALFEQGCTEGSVSATYELLATGALTAE